MSDSALTALAHWVARYQPSQVTDPSRDEAAVAVVLAPSPASLLLIRRAVHDGDPWSGQMGLPGGRRDPGDGNLVETAARETWEEVGISLDPGSVSGSLDDLAPSTESLPPIIVRPHVFVLEERPRELRLSKEVQYARWVALEQLVEPNRYRPYYFEQRGISRSWPAYHLDEDIVWGLTERVLSRLLAGWGIF